MRALDGAAVKSLQSSSFVRHDRSARSTSTPTSVSGEKKMVKIKFSHKDEDRHKLHLGDSGHHPSAYSPAIFWENAFLIRNNTLGASVASMVAADRGDGSAAARARWHQEHMRAEHERVGKSTDHRCGRAGGVPSSFKIFLMGLILHLPKVLLKTFFSYKSIYRNIRDTVQSSSAEDPGDQPHMQEEEPYVRDNNAEEEQAQGDPEEHSTEIRKKRALEVCH